MGVAVADLDSAIELYKTSFGARFKQRVADKESGLDVAFLVMGDVEIELLASLREDSTIGKFLAKRGPGLHHLAYAVPDVRRALADGGSSSVQPYAGVLLRVDEFRVFGNA